MKRIAILTMSLFAALATVATTAAADEARLRVLHASPDAPAVDIYVDGAEVVPDLAYPDITGYLELAGGSYLVEVFPASADGSGAPVISATVTLAANTDYTVAAIGQLAAIEPLVLVDDNSAPAAGNAHLRFVHASPNAPAVDIAVTGGDVVVPNAAFKDAAPYLPLPMGNYDLEVRAAGTMTVALPLPGITLEAGKVYTAFAVGLLGETPELTAKLVVDATFDQTAPPATGTGLAALDGSGEGWSATVRVGLLLTLLGLAMAALIGTRQLQQARSRS